MQLAKTPPRIQEDYVTRIVPPGHILIAPTWRKDFGERAWISTSLVEQSKADGTKDSPNKRQPPIATTTRAILPTEYSTNWSPWMGLPIVAECIQAARAIRDIIAARKSIERAPLSPPQGAYSPAATALRLSPTFSMHALSCEVHDCWLKLPKPDAAFLWPSPLLRQTAISAPLTVQDHALTDFGFRTDGLHQLLRDLLALSFVRLKREGKDILLVAPDEQNDETLADVALKPDHIGHIAVSYHHDDHELVERIIATLRSRMGAVGFQVWFDDEIPIASAWEKVLEEKFSRAKAALVVMTASACASQWVQREIDFAKSHNVPIVPISIARSRIKSLGDLQWFEPQTLPGEDAEPGQEWVPLYNYLLRALNDERLPSVDSTGGAS